MNSFFTGEYPIKPPNLQLNKCEEFSYPTLKMNVSHFINYLF